MRSVDGSMRGMIVQALEQAGHSRRVVLTLPHFTPLVECVATSALAAAIPVQFAIAFAEANNLRVFDLPFVMPVPEIRLYWHSRRTRDPAHRSLPERVLELCEVFRV